MAYPDTDWVVDIAADEAALKTLLNNLRTAGTEPEISLIVYHPGIGFAVPYLKTAIQFHVGALLAGARVFHRITNPALSV